MKNVQKFVNFTTMIILDIWGPDLGPPTTSNYAPIPKNEKNCFFVILRVKIMSKIDSKLLLRRKCHDVSIMILIWGPIWGPLARTVILY